MSLIEVVVSTALVGVLMVASMTTLGSTHRTRREIAERVGAPGLAQELLSEALSMPYEEPSAIGLPIGRDAGEATRAEFDDLDDYHGWDSPPTERDGAEINGYQGWRRAVTVEFLTPGTLAPRADDLGLKRITVSVTDPDGAVTTLTGLRWRDGTLEQATPVDLQAVTWVGVSLRVADAAAPTRAGAALPNLVVDPNAN